MSPNRRVLPAALTLLAILLTAPTATAQPPNPLYRLVDTAAQRLGTADPVAATKWINGGSIADPQRVTAVLDAVGADARAHGVDPQYVRTVFTDQIAATEGVQYIRFGQWKFDPATAPTTAPDLADSRAQIDGYNKTMVEEIARRWDSLHGAACAPTLAAATESVATVRVLDPLYRQALASATRSYCSRS
ncbi:chorismate mutase [Mycobacterium sp. IDR2000157661]|uniref:chorismate mutase n=1 Tax=Mycobacterium sp. IDR2000157661 TaxID=2867005 RepID=UPI001EEC1F7E|nr:chorismate mutase [Mycobacterium sp. IDR2000157661]ULE31248.1 chorismate mutase [Mycobacterium sp. IDR2000157661]